MELYMVMVQETLERTFPVRADTIEQALDVIHERYVVGDIVLDADDFAGVHYTATEAVEYERELVQ